MDGKTIEEILLMIARLSTDQGMSRPVRLRIEYSDATDLIEVPFSLIRQRDRIAEPHQLPIGPERSPVRPVSRDPVDAEEAIRIVIFRAGARRTGPELIQDVQDAWPNRWADATITNTAVAMARPGGALVNHTRDPRDGYGKGYGLMEWTDGTTPGTEE